MTLFRSCLGSTGTGHSGNVLNDSVRYDLHKVEERLAEYPGVERAVVRPRSDGLVAYYIAGSGELRPEALSAHLSSSLPPYLVPTTYLRVVTLPLTAPGPTKAAPSGSTGERGSRCFERPTEGVETALANIWSELLGVENVSRHDNFFELGGTSLLAVLLAEQLHEMGLTPRVPIFSAPVLRDLAEAIDGRCTVDVPPRSIPADCQSITPEMLPLIDLTQEDIEQIIAETPGGLANIQDLYALAPLQGRWTHWACPAACTTPGSNERASWIGRGSRARV